MRDGRVGSMLALVCLTVLLAAPAAATAASVFKCRDAAGRLYFSDRACPADQSGEALDLKPVPRISGDGEGPPSDTLLQDRARRVDNAIEDRKAARETAEKRRAERCDALRERLGKLVSDNCDADGKCTIYALVEKDAAGNRVVLSENAKRAEAERIRGLVATSCR